MSPSSKTKTKKTKTKRRFVHDREIHVMYDNGVVDLSHTVNRDDWTVSQLCRAIDRNAKQFIERYIIGVK